jgi:hypothetical protein
MLGASLAVPMETQYQQIENISYAALDEGLIPFW